MSLAAAAELGRVHDPDALPFAYVPAKVLVPTPRPGSIARVALVNRLRAARGFPLVTLVGPPGSGKTTVLAQWASRDERPFAWVTIDEHDNDPLVLLRHVAAAVDRVAPLEHTALNALRSRTRSLWTSSVPRLAAALSSLESPVVLVLDDASRLASSGSLDVLSVLIDHMPTRSTLALAGRSPFRLATASLRAQDRLFELGPDRLSLSAREAEVLLRATSIRLDDEEISSLVECCDGWAAGLYLSALAIRDGVCADAQPGGDDRYLAEYFRSECLGAHTDRQLEFLRRTSILETLSAPLCNAVLGRNDSARELAALGASNLFVVPVDRSGRSYRCHRLFRELLRRELEREEPELIPQSHGLASDWFAASGEPLAAVDHAVAARDTERVARLVASLDVPQSGGAADGWLQLFDEGELERHPSVATAGAWAYACAGRVCEARRLIGIAESSGDVGAALLRAAMCEDGVAQMLADAGAALDAMGTGDRWRPFALLLEGVALALLGDPERADEALARAVDSGETLFAPAQRARLAHASDAGADRVTAGALGHAIAVRALLRRGRTEEACATLETACREAASLSPALPWLFAQTQLELARAQVTLRDARAAQASLDRAGAVLRDAGGLGTLETEASELQVEIDELRARPGNSFGLTPAELRVIPLLASHLSFSDIGGRFRVSRNTIKTQAISVYRKLGVTSRGEAIERARELGLLDPGDPCLR